MRRRARRWVAVAACLLLAACAGGPGPQPAPPPAQPPAAQAGACVAPTHPVERPEFCALPADVRAFVADRDACDHFRDEPWPEGDTDQDRERRQFILQKVRSLCAGSDRELEALLVRYRDDPAVMKVLSQFERNIEATP